MSESQSANNKRIAKNSMFLYIRMFFILCIQLYSSRLVLNILGVEDFGLYNVVASFVVIFSFINGSMVTATQRFLSFELGEGNLDKLKKIFAVSVNLHFLVSIFIIIVAETFGLWFLNNKMQIPEARVYAANWIYQLSVFSLFFNIIRTPYNAALISHEKMNLFAIISVFDVFLKLVSVLMLPYLLFDRLIVYGLFIFIVSIIVFALYYLVATSQFKECRYFRYWNWSIAKKLFNFSGWMLLGCSTNMLSTQGINILINIYFGPVLNATRAIAVQVNSAVKQFVDNFITAARPQIVKYYAQDRIMEMNKLVFYISKFSFYLLWILVLPVLLNTEYILKIWLKILPEYVVLFTQLVLIDLLITSFYTTIGAISQAYNKIMKYQLIISVGFLSAFLITWLFYDMGYPVYYTFYVLICIDIIGLILRLIEIKLSCNFPLYDFVKKVLIPILIVVFISGALNIYLSAFFPVDTIVKFILYNLLYLGISLMTIWILGVSKEERKIIVSQFKKIKEKI